MTDQWSQSIDPPPPFGLQGLLVWLWLVPVNALRKPGTKTDSAVAHVSIGIVLLEEVMNVELSYGYQPYWWACVVCSGMKDYR